MPTEAMVKEKPLFRTSPFPFMRRFTDEMERMFEDFGLHTWPGFFKFPEFETAWSPEIEVLKKNGQLVLRADLPGLTKDEVKVEITEDSITIEGERKLEKEEKKEGYFRSERSYGKFYRCIPLPEEAMAETAKASFKNGVLEIVMDAPKLKETRARRLEIKGS